MSDTIPIAGELMLFQYRIYHSEKTKRQTVTHPLSKDDELYQYRRFPTSFNEHYDREYAGLINASCVPATPEKCGMRITLETQLSKDDADNSLRKLLHDLNTQIPGLNFICASWLVIVTKDETIAERCSYTTKEEADKYATQKRQQGYQTNVIPFP